MNKYFSDILDLINLNEWLKEYTINKVVDTIPNKPYSNISSRIKLCAYDSPKYKSNPAGPAPKMKKEEKKLNRLV